MPGVCGKTGVRGGVRPGLVPSAHLFCRYFLLRPEQIPINVNKDSLHGGKMSEEIGFEVRMTTCYDEALEKVIAALKTEGFGVLTRIDVRATLKEKIGEDFRPYSILGACNPPLAHRALSADPVVGLMLPCNVPVEANGEDETIVRIANPEVMMRVGGFQENETVQAVASEARTRLERVANSLLEVWQRG
jgi:uncharacterized protein (DUF302 family)